MNEEKKERVDRLYLRMAFIWAENSYAIRRKVGALIVKNNSIISDGYNGTPCGFPNVCEYAVGGKEGEDTVKTLNIEELKYLEKNGYKLVSYPCVLHAEANAITKLSKSGQSSEGATIYVTDEPCVDCAKLIIQSGITRVIYARDYRLHNGIQLLREANIEVKQIL
jgi:dCMP deaminase